MIEINEYVPESLQGLKSICTARNALQSCDVNLIFGMKPPPSKSWTIIWSCAANHTWVEHLVSIKFYLSNVTGSDEQAEENYFRLMKTSPENISRDDINKINSPSLFRDMNNRWICFCPSQALIYYSMPQAVLFIVFVIQYNFIENNIVNCRSNAKNKP